MNEVQALCEERTDHASGDDGSRPDAQRAAGRATGGGGHGASSGVGNESDAKLQGEKAKHQSDENDANLKR